MLNEIKQDIINNGGDPDDFNIVITKNGHSVTPKWFYETKQIAKKEDEPIIDDINTTAETVVYTNQDIMVLADTVNKLMLEVIKLKQEG